MKRVSLSMNYTKQRLYRNILVALGVEQENARYEGACNKTYLLTSDQFVTFVSRALLDTKAVFSLRSMSFRVVDVANEPQQELDLNQAQKTAAENPDQFLAELIGGILGVPVEVLRVPSPTQEDFSGLPTACQCPGCTSGMSLAEALRANYRETGTVLGAVNQNNVEKARPSDADLADMHEKALAWDKKITEATEQALDFFYQQLVPCPAWSCWKHMEKSNGHPAWLQFRPKAEYKDIPVSVLFSMAQRLRSQFMDMNP